MTTPIRMTKPARRYVLTGECFTWHHADCPVITTNGTTCACECHDDHERHATAR